jgi:hypothetical protein
MENIIELFDHYLTERGLSFQAVINRQQDIGDCIALSPTGDELDNCLNWLLERDGNPYWPENVRASLRKLAKETGYAYHPSA